MTYQPARRRNPWLKLALWIGIPLGILFVLCSSPFVAFWIWTNNNVREVHRLAGEIEAKGEPLTLGQLSQDFQIPEGQEDVGQIWIEAMEPISTREFREKSKSFPFIGYEASEPLPVLGQPWAKLEESEKLLQSCEFTFAMIDEAVRRGGYARFPIDYSLGHQTLMPHTQNSRNLARILQLDLEVKAHRNDAAGAAKTLKALFVLSRCTKHEPIIVAQLVGVAMDGVAKKSLSEKLCLLSFEEGDLRDFRSHLQAIRPVQSVRIALLGERAMGFAGMQDLSVIDPKMPKKPAMASDARAFLEYMSRYIAALDREFPDALDEVQKIESDLNHETDNLLKSVQRVLTMLLVPATGALFEAIAKDMSTTAAADAGIAIEFYRRETGKIPSSLGALVPKYLSSVPIDPFTGNPMIYKIDEKGFKIYSIGKNKVDDGGRLENKPGEDNRIRDEGLHFPLK